MGERKLLAAIEAGGTTWVAALAHSDDLGAPFERLEVPTSSNPCETISVVRSWLRTHVTGTEKYGRVHAVGVASFGPIDPKPDSPTYGFVTSTPKPGWTNTDVCGMLGLIARDGADNTCPTDMDRALDGEFARQGLPFLFDTDVNAPALAEFTHEKATNSSSRVSSSAYVTVGTGVGAGVVANDRTVAGLLHPEAGHVLMQRAPGDDYAGACPFHGACLEGMVCSRALAERAELWKVAGDPSSGFDAAQLAGLPDDHPVWDTAAFYLAQLAASLVLIVSIEKIVFGGGIFNRAVLYDKIRLRLKEQLNGYIQHPMLTTDEGLERFVARSVWGSQAGLVGTAFLARQALEQSSATAAEERK